MLFLSQGRVGMTLVNVTLTTTILECLLFSGVVYGWTYIVDVLLDVGYFRYICENPKGNVSTAFLYNSSVNSTQESCYEAKSQLNLVYTVSVATCSTCTVFIGYAYDKWGTWFTRTFAIGMFIIASFIMIFGQVEQSWLLYPAMLLFSFGGSCLMICNFNLANLSRKYRTTFVGIYSGAYDSSAVVFMLVKMVYDAGLTLPAIFVIYACCGILCGVRTFILTPRQRVPFPLPKRFIYGIVEFKRLVKRNVRGADADKDFSTCESAMTSQESNVERRTFLQCLQDPFYWGNVAFMSVLHLREVFFLGTVGSWLKSFSGGTSIDTLLFVCGIFTVMGILIAPFCGLLTDKLQRKFSGNTENGAESMNAGMLAVAVTIGITSCVASLFSLVVIFPVLEVQYVSFALCTIFRGFLYSSTTSFVILAYPTKHIGKLFGVLVTIFGVVTYLQYPLLNLALREGYELINVGFLIASVLTSLQPVALFMHHRRKRLVRFDSKFATDCPG